MGCLGKLASVAVVASVVAMSTPRHAAADASVFIDVPGVTVFAGPPPPPPVTYYRPAPPVYFVRPPYRSRYWRSRYRHRHRHHYRHRDDDRDDRRYRHYDD